MVAHWRCSVPSVRKVTGSNPNSRHIGTLGKSFTRSSLYDVMWLPCLVAKFDSCNSLLSSIHTLLVNILWCVRLYIKRKYHILTDLGHFLMAVAELKHDEL